MFECVLGGGLAGIWCVVLWSWPMIVRVRPFPARSGRGRSMFERCAEKHQMQELVDGLAVRIAAVDCVWPILMRWSTFSTFM